MELEPTDGVVVVLFCCWQRQVRAYSINSQSVTSPVATKHSLEQPIRTEGAENITDWANRTGAIESLPILNTEASENRDFAILPAHVTY